MRSRHAVRGSYRAYRGCRSVYLVGRMIVAESAQIVFLRHSIDKVISRICVRPVNGPAVDVRAGQFCVLIRVMGQVAQAVGQPCVGAGNLRGIVVPAIDESLKPIGAAGWNGAGCRRVLRRGHAPGIKHVELSLLASGDKPVARKQRWPTRTQVRIAAIQSVEVGHGVSSAQAEAIKRWRANVQLYNTLAQIGCAVDRAVAGGEIDVARAVRHQPISRLPDASTLPALCSYESSNLGQVRCAVGENPTMPARIIAI